MEGGTESWVRPFRDGDTGFLRTDSSRAPHNLVETGRPSGRLFLRWTMTTKWGNLDGWKLSTIVLAAVLIGFMLAQLTGAGLVKAQSGGEAKVQLDTSNCAYGVNYNHNVPNGSFVVQVVHDANGGQMFVDDVCK